MLRNTMRTIECARLNWVLWSTQHGTLAGIVEMLAFLLLLALMGYVVEAIAPSPPGDYSGWVR